MNNYILMNKAVSNGNIGIVKQLHRENIGCDIRIFNIACGKGHLNVLKFLHKKGQCCTISAIIFALIDGRRDIIYYLYHKYFKYNSNEEDMSNVIKSIKKHKEIKVNKYINILERYMNKNICDEIMKNI